MHFVILADISRLTIVRALATLLLILVWVSCNKENVRSADALDQLYLLGEWKLEQREINGIASSEIVYGQLVMDVDDDPTDLTGHFRHSDGIQTIEGKFTVFSNLKTIVFELGEDIGQYDFIATTSSFTLIIQQDRDKIKEYWLRS